MVGCTSDRVRRRRQKRGTVSHYTRLAGTPQRDDWWKEEILDRLMEYLAQDLTSGAFVGQSRNS